MLIEVTEDTFDAEIAQSDIPCVILFTAKWCALCGDVKQSMEALSNEFDGQVKFCIVNTDENKKLRIKFAVAALPYIVYVANGTKSPLFDGLVTQEALKERVQFMLNGGKAPTTSAL